MKLNPDPLNTIPCSPPQAPGVLDEGIYWFVFLLCSVGDETQEMKLLECQKIALSLNYASRARVDTTFSTVIHVMSLCSSKAPSLSKLISHCVRWPCFLYLLSHAWTCQFSPPPDYYPQYVVRSMLAMCMSSVQNNPFLFSAQFLMGSSSVYVHSWDVWLLLSFWIIDCLLNVGRINTSPTA